MTSTRHKSPERRRVLIVEDDLLQSASVEAIIEADGLEVSGKTRSGTGAVYLARVTRPDVVVMDLRLAGTVGGIEAAAKIRQTIACGFVFHTAYGSGAAAQNIHRLFPDAMVVVKPSSATELSGAIRDVLQRTGPA